MKFLGNLLLVILFVPLFLLTVLSVTVKFQLLQPDFWQTTFRSHDVYTNLAASLKNMAEIQTVKEGGSLSDARVLTNLITPATLQDFLEKNFKNILGFVNGKEKEAVVYIPVTKLPAGFLPRNFGKITENTPLSALLAEFNMHGITDAQIQAASHIGLWAGYLFGFDLVLLAIFITGFCLIAEKGKKLGGASFALILSGFLTLVATLFIFIIRGSMLTDWVKSKEPIQIILRPFAPYVLGEILKVWLYIGAFALIVGIVLLFFKKK